MKNFFLITALCFSVAVYAQHIQQQGTNYYERMNNEGNVIQASAGNQINSQMQVQQVVTPKEKCKDCEEVKAAIKASHSASSGSYHKKPRNRAKIFSGRMHMKMKKIFSHRKKIKTNYDVCFNWK